MSDKLQQITFRPDGHLTEEGIAAYAEALLANDVERLPKALLEHVAHCEVCQHEGIQLYGLLTTLSEKQEDQDEEDNPEQSGSRRNPIWRWALVALTAVLAFYIYRTIPIDAPTPAPTQQPATPSATPNQFMNPQQQPADRPVADTQKPEKTEKPSDGMAQYAANFIPSEQLESLSGEVFRSAGVTASAPAKEQVFKPQALVRFEWKNDAATPLQIILLDNRGKELLRQDVVGNEFSWQSPDRPGLYYWKLESPDDLLYVGKFLLKS